MNENIFAGINVGSVSAALVLVDVNENIVYRDYRFHGGNIYHVLKEMLEQLPVKRLLNFGVVAEKGREFFRAGVEINEQVAIIRGVNNSSPGARSIVNIGGQNFGLILFDEAGKYKRYISNSACAAGTGSFLDQQAFRLGFSGSDELGKAAEGYSGDPPKIATRCAVFARTDLVHIQQQGYALPAIAAGLCQGVALNIFDTLFTGVEYLKPVVVTGGVAKNKKVVDFLSAALHTSLTSLPDAEYIGALGAACFAKELHSDINNPSLISTTSFLSPSSHTKSYFYAPLSNTKTSIPSHSGWKSWIRDGVEIDIYNPFKSGSDISGFLGLDIGSTSTKATFMNTEREPILGLYTRTNGQPVKAIQKLTRILEELEDEFKVNFKILAAGTTGSGRKFIQKITNADYAVDEITAHARAAYHLNPDVDTIIEIGGQDAKFTVLKNGNVIFSVMNYVCAAGTGSFIEEQTKRLGIALSDYTDLAMHASAPLISNRCTVFMERDLNHYMSQGYKREELLASALHSVRDNYLSKVAHVNKIGDHIVFQGATAKNHALVAAFEQKLKKSIYVSKYCHLTGALGVCLKMTETLNLKISGFRKKIHNEKITVGEYICEFCNNNCKIKTTEIDNETLGWGYLCGRDEQDPGYKKRDHFGFNLLGNHRKVFKINSNASYEKEAAEVRMFNEFKKGGILSVVRKSDLSLARLRNRIYFNTLELRKEIFSYGITPKKPEQEKEGKIKIGLPDTLNMAEYLPLWQLFFKRLGFHTISPLSEKKNIAAGKKIRGAEYCTPITEFHAYIKDLSFKADYIFFPQLFENLDEKEQKTYCYYTNYAVPIVKNIQGLNLSEKMIAPVLNLNSDIHEVIKKIFVALPQNIKEQLTFNQVEAAFLMAWDWFKQRNDDLKSLFLDQLSATNDIGVVLIGRPYLIMNPTLNKGIPDKLAEMGVQSFAMDMVPVDEEKLDAARDFLTWNHWRYGNTIIRVTEMVAQNIKLFPVYLTSFKCSPDSFIISYFKRIMDYYQKPYIILQLDDHETGEGYDTRLEAAVETFRSFKISEKQKTVPSVKLKRKFEEKIYLLPDHDTLSAKLMQAGLEKFGINSRIIEQDEETYSRSAQINDGQCLPVTALTLGIQNTIEKYKLDPQHVAFYCSSELPVSCNFPQYPVMIKQTLEKMGHGLEKVDILVNRLFPTDLPLELMYEMAMSYILAGMVHKMVYKIRPREINSGTTDHFKIYAEKMLFQCVRDGKSKESTFEEIVAAFLTIDKKDIRLPQAGIVGDLYVRSNDLFNQHLVKTIETSGTEVSSVPFFDSWNLWANKYFSWLWEDGNYIGFLGGKVANNTLNLLSNKLITLAEPILGKKKLPLKNNPLVYLARYGLTTWHGGESAENLLKVFYLYENYPDLKFIVNVNPIFCCPGLISEAIYKKLEKEINIPIVSITYDGTQTNKNELLSPYLHFAAEARAKKDK